MWKCQQPQSLSDLSFILSFQDVVLSSEIDHIGEVVEIETLSVVLQRGNDFVAQTLGLCPPEEGEVCFVYSLTTTGNTFISSKDNAVVVFATFEVRIGDSFHHVAPDPFASSVATRSRLASQNLQELEVLGTTFIPYCMPLEGEERSICIGQTDIMCRILSSGCATVFLAHDGQ